MKQVINTEKIPIKLWLDDIEDGALEQAKNLANLPFVFRHIALMPDAHLGYGMPIGGVMATMGVVVPNAVGVDIGCGMLAVRTSLADIDIQTLKKMMGAIRKVVPVGFNHQKEKQKNWLSVSEFNELLGWSVIEKEYGASLKQIGTLGGGNHFIEIQKGDDGYIWIMIHSGSRNIGYKVAKHYNNIAIEKNKKWFSSVPLGGDLAFLPLETEEGQNYLIEMHHCVQFALYNRQLMLDNIKEQFLTEFPDTRFHETINIAHNYAAIEHHFNQNVMVHRKGATSAKVGEFGIIPGSQGACSYIVKGLGNPESFESCSHGAGRKMGRKQAQRELNLEETKQLLDNLGVVHGVRNVKDLDEAPGAYKNIDEVMENQTDLVEIVTKLTPLAVIKG